MVIYGIWDASISTSIETHHALSVFFHAHNQKFSREEWRILHAHSVKCIHTSYKHKESNVYPTFKFAFYLVHRYIK